MTALLVLALLSAPADDGFIVFAPKGDGTVHLDEPGNLLEVTEVKKGATVSADGFWVSPEVLASLTETRAEWREEAREGKSRRLWYTTLALFVGWVAGLYGSGFLRRKSRQLSPPR